MFCKILGFDVFSSTDCRGNVDISPAVSRLIFHKILLQQIYGTSNQFGSTPTESIQMLKSQKKTPEMKRSREVHSRRAQKHYLTPKPRKVTAV